MRWQRANARLTDLSHTLPDAIRRQGAAALAEAPDGVLWIGLKRPGGLIRFRQGRFEEVKPVPAGNVQALYRDYAGRLWIASAEAGLGRIDDPAADKVAVRVYGRAHGLSSSELWCLTSDRDGRIYAGSARGVDRIDPASDRITHFSSADGLASGDIRSALCDRNGSLWFLSNRGLSRFQPMPSGWQPLPETRITGIRVAGVPHPVSDLGQKRVADADFPWGRNSVQIDFSALAFQSREQISYQFRLLGTRDGWSVPSPDATVHFSNLAPGRYQFLVRAVSADTSGDAPPASFAFTIAPPPWRRWLFETGIAGLLLAIACAAHRLLLERRLALERLRSSIATDLHDDIGASLSRIAAITEAVKSRVACSDTDSHRMLSTIAETSRETVGAMSDIVWSIDPRRDDLGDVIARIRAFGSDVLEPRGIQWNCEGPPETFDHTLLPEQRRQFFLICKEAIHNIARHSRAQNVMLRIVLQGNAVRCDIQDDGCGLSFGDREGLGVGSMHRRAASLGGEFRISPRPEGGIQATLHFPLHSRNA